MKVTVVTATMNAVGSSLMAAATAGRATSYDRSLLALSIVLAVISVGFAIWVAADARAGRPRRVSHRTRNAGAAGIAQPLAKARASR